MGLFVAVFVAKEKEGARPRQLSGTPIFMDSPRVRTGLDRLAQGDEPGLRGAKVSLLCHPASLTADFVHARDVLAHRCQAQIVSLLGPEHGLEATAQDMITVQDAGRGSIATPTYSLYGETEASLAPKPEYFHDAQWVVIDLQDVGSRYYTYVWTATMTAEVALAAGKRVLLLDRPNPLGGEAWQVEGGGIDAGFESFVGYHNVSVRHGLTLAEIVCMALTERARVDLGGLETWTAQGWERSWMFHDTGLPWVMPSPNMPSLLTACIYPGQCLFEGTLMSEGRGTTRPFELFGAPWIQAQNWLDRLDRSLCPGLAFRPLAFEPTFQKHAGTRCAGLQIHVTHPYQVQSLRSSWALLAAAYGQSCESADPPVAGAIAAAGAQGHEDAKRRFEWRSETYEYRDDHPAIDLLAGGPQLREVIESGASLHELLAHQETARQAFLERRRAYLLYPERDGSARQFGASALDLELAGSYLPGRGSDPA